MNIETSLRAPPSAWQIPIARRLGCIDGIAHSGALGASPDRTASSTDRAAISTIARRTHTDRRDAESGRCNGLNRPSRPRMSSSHTQSFMATSIHADTSW